MTTDNALAHPFSSDRPRRRCRAAASAIVAAVAIASLSACGPRSERTLVGAATDEEPAAIDAPTAGISGAALRSQFGGLYIPDEFAARALPSGAFEIRTARACTVLRDVLLAGDWQPAQELVVAPEAAAILAIGGLAPMLLLSQGPHITSVRMSDRADGCTATIAEASVGPTTITTGIADAVGDGWAVATRCTRFGDDLGVDVVIGADGTDSSEGTVEVSGLIHLWLEGQGPQRIASLDDSSDSAIVTGPLGVLDLFTVVLRAELAGGDPTPPPGSNLLTLDGSSTAPGTATIETVDGVMRGTVDLVGLAWDDQVTGANGSAHLSFSFECTDVADFA